MQSALKMPHNFQFLSHPIRRHVKDIMSIPITFIWESPPSIFQSALMTVESFIYLCFTRSNFGYFHCSSEVMSYVVLEEMAMLL